MDARKLQHDTHGRYILSLIKKFNLGRDIKYCQFISEEELSLSDINLSELKIHLKRKPEDGEIYYKYIGPKDKKNRPFCHDLLVMNKVFSESEIQFLSDELDYDVLFFQGSYGCRHEWKQYKGKVIFTPPPTPNQMRVLTAPGQPFTSPYPNPKTYTNYY